MVESGRNTPAERLRTAPKRGPLVVIGCCVALGGATPALAVASGPTSAVGGPISARYQAIRCDTAPWGDSARVAVGADSALAAAHTGFPALRGRFPSRESCSAITRYQLRKVVSNSQRIVSLELLATPAQYIARTHVNTSRYISSVPSQETAPISPTDARRLFQLAVALAAAYVLFLAAWFWGTRERRSRFGSAARS